MALDIKKNKQLIALPITQCINRSEGGNIWSLNLHSSHPSELYVHNKFSAYKAHDTGLIKLRVIDREIEKALHPFMKGFPFKKKISVKNFKDKIVTTHIKSVRIFNF